MISRNNILEITSKLGKESFHSAILTCYTFDPVYFYEIHLPVLRKLGISNIIVMMDAGQYDQMMETAGLYADMFSGYTILRQVTHSSTGVFHPKIHLLLGEKRGAIFIGSGNLTHSGMSLNDEVWAELYYDDENNETIPIFKYVWDYLYLLPSNDMTRTQQSWMLETTPWLSDALKNENTDPTVNISGTIYQFIANTSTQSIGEIIKEYIDSEQVESLTVVSPFYDDNAYSIERLIEGHEIKDKTFFVDTQNGRCPQTCPKDTNVYDWCLEGRESRQKLHAKIIQVITQSSTFLIMGSANATRNAMGFNKNGYNDEACLLIKDTKRTDYIEALGIKPSDDPLSETDLVDMRSEQPLDNTTKKTHNILWACLEENSIKLKLQNAADVNGVMIALYDKNDERLCCLPYAESVRVDTDIHPVWVVLLRENHIISNLCLIQDEEVILNFHPNERNRKLLRYLDKDAPWENDLGHILPYLSFDDTENVPNQGFTLSSSNSTRKRVTEVEKAQYDMTPTAIKSRMATNTNLQLVEFLSSVFQQGRKKESQSDLTAKEQDDEDNVSSSKRTLTDSVRYSNHVNRLLNNGIQHFQKKLPKSSDPIMTWSNEKRYANQNEYSAMLCGVFLALFDKSEDSAIIAKRKGLLLNFLSLSCLAFFHGWNYNDNYRIGKMKGMLRNFCGRALLLLAHYNWRKEQEDEVSLTFLNIFNQYKLFADENHSVTGLIEDALTELLKDAERNGLSISDSSLLLLRETFNRYSSYLSKEDKDRRVRYEEVEAGDFIYISGVGFCSFVKGKMNTAGYYQYTYIYPCLEREMLCSTKTSIKVI